jgi:hypothetical protein
MKLSHILPFIVGSAAAILASTSPAHALDFNWSFSNVTGDTPGTVTGTVTRLVEGTNSGSSPVVVTVTSSPLAGSVGVYNWLDDLGTGFTVTLGNITQASSYFQMGGYSLFLGTAAGNGTYYPQLIGGGYNIANNTLDASVSFTPAASVPFDIPGGATIPSVGALLALGAMRKARKSIASKTRLANPVCASVS